MTFKPLSLNILIVFAAFGPVCDVVGSGNCEAEDLTRCSEPLRMLTNGQELALGASKEELDELCPQLNRGLTCVYNFISRCLATAERENFVKLSAGMYDVVIKVCNDKTYQEEYLKHAPCMSRVQVQYELCAKSYNKKISAMDTSMNEKNLTKEETVNHFKTLCCSFQSYIRCSKEVIEEECGVETAVFTENYLDKMSTPFYELHCRDYKPSSGECNLAGSAIKEQLSISLLNICLLVALHYSLQS